MQAPEVLLVAREHSAPSESPTVLGDIEFLLPNTRVSPSCCCCRHLAKLLLGLMKGEELPIAEELRTREGSRSLTHLVAGMAEGLLFYWVRRDGS